LDEVVEAARSGAMEECFGTGTAAVVSPVGELRYMNDRMSVGDGTIGAVTKRIYDTITGIQLGQIQGPAGWSVEV
ncbi:MAG: branched chain amino acid aminotransferase, partial [Lachnospiraceae bacterium]|nr:branched chain amino acid aminotransferase [Lachnospiraceae bacterium]